MAEKEYIVPVCWEMCGLVKVKASSADEAIDKVIQDNEDYPLPEDSYYVDGSFAPSYNEADTVEHFTELYEKGELDI